MYVFVEAMRNEGENVECWESDKKVAKAEKPELCLPIRIQLVVSFVL